MDFSAVRSNDFFSVTPYFVLCRGFITPDTTHEWILRGDGLATEWIYPILQTAESGDAEIQLGEANIGEEVVKVYNGQIMNFRPYFRKKAIWKSVDTFGYFIAFNPIPYTATHTVEVIKTKEKVVVPSSDKLRFVVTFTGKSYINGHIMSDNNYGLVNPGKSLEIQNIGDHTAVGIFTRETNEL